LTPLKNSVLVPPGVAHGFQCLEDNTTVHYLHSQPFAPELAEGVRFDDSELKISWPLPVTVISQADLELPSFFTYRGRN
jgi:dTDP-4-dehydrorhamnose 3,5-epimerase